MQKIEAKQNFEDNIRLPELIDLAAMKAYALGRRSKWKDYVDLYFILKDYFTIEQISNNTLNLLTHTPTPSSFRSIVLSFHRFSALHTSTKLLNLS